MKIESAGGVSPALAVNVGIGGMLIEGPPLSYGEFVDIVAELPGLAGPTKLPAVVRWTSGRCFGVQFRELGAQVTHALTEIVSRAAASSPPASAAGDFDASAAVATPAAKIG